MPDNLLPTVSDLLKTTLSVCAMENNVNKCYVICGEITIIKSNSDLNMKSVHSKGNRFQSNRIVMNLTEYNALQCSWFTFIHSVIEQLIDIVAIQKPVQLQVIIECYVSEILWHQKCLRKKIKKKNKTKTQRSIFNELKMCWHSLT